MNTPACLEFFRREIARRLDKAESLFSAAETCENVATLLGGHVYFRDIGSVELMYEFDDLSSFDAVVPLMQEFARRGYHTNKSNPFSDIHNYDLRHYYMVDCDGKDAFAIEARLKAHGASCRRVQVGVKEEPVYEFVCD